MTMSEQEFKNHVRRALKNQDMTALFSLRQQARTMLHSANTLCASKAMLRLQYPTLSNKRIREMAMKEAR